MSSERSDPVPPMRVALFTPAWPPGLLPNGIATYTGYVVPGLRDLGVDVSVIAGEVDPGCSDPAVLRAAPRRDPAPVRAAARLRDWVSPGATSERRQALAIARVVQRLERERGLDLVEMEESFGWCGRIASLCGVPVVARLHGPWFLNGAMVADPTTRAFRRRVRSEGSAIARVAGISAPSRDVLERTRSRYELELPDADVIPCPVPPAAAADRWAADACEANTILFVGRFDNHKGADVVIEAFASLRPSAPDARLVLVGPEHAVTDAAGRSFRLHEFLDSRLPRAADRAAVDWLGTQRPEAIRRLRRRAAVTVVCSRYEVFGYTLAEAMAQGCPVVATASGGLGELVENERSGLVARSADPDDLARAVLRLLRDRELAARLGRTAITACAEQCDPAQIAGRTLALYRRVLRR
jgi:glycosyltransferase involved in cell wall biosynthesis